MPSSFSPRIWFQATQSQVSLFRAKANSSMSSFTPFPYVSFPPIWQGPHFRNSISFLHVLSAWPSKSLALVNSMPSSTNSWASAQLSKLHVEQCCIVTCQGQIVCLRRKLRPKEQDKAFWDALPLEISLNAHCIAILLASWIHESMNPFHQFHHFVDLSKTFGSNVGSNSECRHA